MSEGLIHYNDIATKELSRALKEICSLRKSRYGDLSLGKLQVSDKLSAFAYTDKNWARYIFGYGIYVFFDGESPVYVGKVISDFRHRLASHKHFDPRPNYAFNRLAQYVAARKLHNPELALQRESFHQLVVPAMENLSIVRINCLDSTVSTRLTDRLERIFRMGLSLENADSMYNAIPRKHGFNEHHTVNHLLGLR